MSCFPVLSIMRIGLVRFLNARPLDYGLRQLAHRHPEWQLHEDIPSRLANQLLDGRLDVALISSIEYLRHKDRLAMIPGLGVCASERADSLFYIRPARSKALLDPAHPVRRIYADHGSRSTITLLRLLYRRVNPSEAEIITIDPAEIIDRIMADPMQASGGLLIGDAALQFHQKCRPTDWFIEDLATWWNREYQLPFVFAVWAYHRDFPAPLEMFQDSLIAGLKHLDAIAAEFSQYPNALEYLSKRLHYQTAQPEAEALRVFAAECRRFQILDNS
ncbi:MAG: menaquinone biosynthesis protein [Leptospiraceae bacterium]|nr:menaquinone biosynthesis protein [Leptospiraceae bacterium]